MASLYVIAIGGTGAKCAEAIVHLAAAGLFSQEADNSKIKILFVDPDNANGNLGRATSTLETYKDCHSLFAENVTRKDATLRPWMSKSVETYGIWSPFEGAINKTLKDFFHYANYNQDDPIGNLFDVLYTDQEKQANLDVGFRGRPAIGSAIMSQVDLRHDPPKQWQQMLNDIEQDFSSGAGNPKLFMCGSIFGGTGASGFPTIGRLLNNKLEEIGGRNKATLGGVLMLPYFQFPSPPPNQKQKEQIHAKSDEFLFKTEAALHYYLGQAQESFDRVYLLGDQDLATVNDKFRIGKDEQKNEAHFIELYAALAARHFWLDVPPAAHPQERGKVVLISRRSQDRISWDDIPGSSSEQVKQKLVDCTRLAFIWSANISPELNSAIELGIDKFQFGAPWFTEFFRGTGLSSMFDRKKPELGEQAQQDAIKRLDQWSETYLRWLAALHYSAEGTGGVGLFNASAFATRQGNLLQEIDKFADLVVGSGSDRRKIELDTIQRIKEKLTPKPRQISEPTDGSVGLAKALYFLCQV
jgi:hypothetical protein